MSPHSGLNPTLWPLKTGTNRKSQIFGAKSRIPFGEFGKILPIK
jgi:hypothetical protein